MSTGYTADVGDGKITAFEDFALTCARAFGALVMLRDSDQSLEATKRYLASGKYAMESTYYQGEVTKATERLAALEAMTDAEARIAALHEADQVRQQNERYNAERAEKKRRYEAMIAQVEAWEPPSEEHVGLKEFMLEQLTRSIEFDCSPFELRVPEVTDGWREEQIAKERERIARAEKEIEEERARNQGRREWVEALLDSLGAVAA